MDVSKQQSFYYHADASAVGGRLTHPLERVIATPASVSLPQAGGFSAARARRFHLDEMQELISIEAAHVHVAGSEHAEHGGYRSTATATVEKLNVLEVVTADRIVAQVSVVHPYDRDRPAVVSLVGSQFVNLAVNGVPVHPRLDRRVFGAGRDAEDAAADGPGFRDLLGVAEMQYEEGAVERARMVDTLGQRFDFVSTEEELDKKGSALCSLVQGVEAETPGEGFGHIIHLPGFGNIFLGELCVSPFSARLTMLRIEMGCMATGQTSACSVFTNGNFMP